MSLERARLVALLKDVDAEVARMANEARWTTSDTAALDQAFDEATTRALRVPALVERSTRLRRLARQFVPRPLRPVLRRAAGRAEGVLRKVVKRLEGRPR